MPTENPPFGLYLRRGDVEAALGYSDFLGGLEEIKALALKDRRWRVKTSSGKHRVAYIFNLNFFALRLVL